MSLQRQVVGAAPVVKRVYDKSKADQVVVSYPAVVAPVAASAASTPAAAASAGASTDVAVGGDGKDAAASGAKRRARHVVVTEADLERLEESEFLNDTLIDFYMRCGLARLVLSRLLPAVHWRFPLSCRYCFFSLLLL